jgi:hypothetical protein
MASFYLSRPAARDPISAPATARVLSELGPPAVPAMAVLLARRKAALKLAALERIRRRLRGDRDDLVPSLETQVVDFPLVPIGRAQE